MTVTAISATEFDVQAESLSCTRLMCRFVTKAARYNAGDSCPRCERNQVNQAGVLQRSSYRVDLTPYQGNGQCCCDHFKFTLQPMLDRMSRAERWQKRKRCKHIISARKFAKEDAQFDALLAALPDQEEQV